MKQQLLKTFFFAAVFACAGLSVAQAQVIVDTWSADGGAWTSANQPDFVASSGGGGTLYTDEAIAEGSNNSESNTGATWTSSIPSGPPASGSGIYEDYYYTVFSTPAVTITATDILADVETITFTLETNADLNSDSVGLSFSGLQRAGDFSSQLLGVDPDFGSSLYLYTWTWDVSGMTSPDSFSLDFTTPAAHTAYFSAQILQTIPEPSTYALLGLGVIAWLGWLRLAQTKVVRQIAVDRRPFGEIDQTEREAS